LTAFISLEYSTVEIFGARGASSCNENKDRAEHRRKNASRVTNGRFAELTGA